MARPMPCLLYTSVWSGDPVILDTDAVTQWDFRGLLERMAQTVYLDEKIRDTVQCCEVTELILLISQVVTRRHNAPPVSYTHLDVYKRQLIDDRKNQAVENRDTCALSGGEDTGDDAADDNDDQQQRRHGVPDGLGNALACLLYTSRCV